MIGETISHYKILEELGRGGMGVVYKAEDTKLGRTVALKFLTPQALGSGQERERFMHEAKTAASLSHPNICTIHEIDEADGRSFIVMEHVEGWTLKEKIGSGPLPLDEVFDIAVQVAGGLQAAHETGIVHRDVKSANIMITPRGRAKIMDFGLAKAAGRTQLTREGTTLGTIAYMSPEQARGGDVDRRTDIWSLGVVLYEMVTGRQPFRGDYEQAVIYSILNTEPEPVTSLRTGVPMELERIIAKALAKNPGERYQTSADLTADLHRLQKALAAGPSPSRGTVPGKASRKRYSLVMWLLMAIILAFVAVQVIPRIFPRRKEVVEQRAAAERTRIVVLPFENLGAPEDDYFADGITEEITSRLAAIRELGVISRKSALHYKNSSRTIPEIGAELAVDYVLEGTVRWEQGPGGGSRVRVTPQLIRVSDDSHIWADRFDEEFEAIFDIQTRIAERVAVELDVTLSGGEKDFLDVRPTVNIVAYQLYLRGAEYLVFGHRPEADYRHAGELLEQAIAIDPGFALAYAKLSHVHRSIYFYGYERTDERLAMAKEAIDRAIELDPNAPEVRRELGYYYYQGILDYGRALEEFTALAVMLPDDAQLLMDIAYIWRRQGHFEQALANLETAFAMSPKDAGLCVEIGQTNLVLRRTEATLEYIEKAIEIAPSGQWGHFMKSLALFVGMGDVQAAREAHEACADKTSMAMIWQRYYLNVIERDYQAILDMFEEASFDVIRMQSFYAPVDMLKGMACNFMGDSERGEAFFEKALELLGDASGENPEDPRIHSAMGLTYAGLGQKTEAVASGRKAIEIYPVTRDAILGVDRMLDLARIYAMVGENAAAIEMIREILSMPAIYTIHSFEFDPRFDVLRNEPTYKKLVREFGGKQL